MGKAWEEQYVDTQVDRAWLELRLRLADRFAAALAEGSIDSLDISTATGESLSVNVDEGYVVMVAGDDLYSTENVDEAAYQVFRVLHDEWQVVHPAFLDTELVEHDEPPAPVRATAESREELQRWVVAAFESELDEPLEVADNGDIPWSSKRGEPVVVSVRAATKIEIWTVLARDVEPEVGQQVVARFAEEYVGLKLVLCQGALVLSRTMVADPFVADRLRQEMRGFGMICDRVGWTVVRLVQMRLEAVRARMEQAEARARKAERRADFWRREAARRYRELKAAERQLDGSAPKEDVA